MKKELHNIRDGHHHNSSYGRKIRLSLPPLNHTLTEIVIAMTLSDAHLAKTSKDAHMKIEQGYKQKDYVFHLFSLKKEYCFSTEAKAYVKKGKLKSYGFKTFSHTSFTTIGNMFYENGKKEIKKGIVLNHINALGLSYGIMSDGSLGKDKKSMILHTQSFTLLENEKSKELNEKFGLHTRVIPHKTKYGVIFIPGQDSPILRAYIKPHIISSFNYKLPK